MKSTSLSRLAFLALAGLSSPEVIAGGSPSDTHCLASKDKISQYQYYAFSGPSQVSQVAMRVSGIVDELLVSQGDSVAKGDSLIRLLPSGEEDAVNVARKRLTLLKERYQSSLSLGDNRHIAALDLLQAEVDMEQAKKELGNAERAERDRTLLAPFSGTIEKTNIEAGEYVSVGQSALRLVNTHHQKVVAEVYSGGNFSSCMNKKDCLAFIEIDDTLKGPYPIDFSTPITDNRKGMFQVGVYMESPNASGVPVNIFFIPKESCSTND